ncbi:MAG: phosphatidylglycerophosphatase A [Bacilli bacterium]|jgi:phosphatidylglycerophosphatase A
MVLLKCLEHFKPSDSNVYSEEEMQKINIDVLAERGVSVDDIASLAYWAQSKYLDNLTLDEMRESVLEILNKRDQFHAILLAVQVDVLAERNLLQEPLQSILYSDLGLFGIDEALAISIAGNYGTIGVTNFGNMDVNKPGKISILQNKKDACHCFLDDIVGAIAAVAAIRVAQRHALQKAMGNLDLNM